MGVASTCLLELLRIDDPSPDQEVGAFLVAEFLHIMRKVHTKG